MMCMKIRQGLTNHRCPVLANINVEVSDQG